MNNTSGLHLYSLGIVVEAKPPESHIALISPVETINIQKSGPIKDVSEVKHAGKVKDLNTNFDTEHKSKDYLRAKWLPLYNTNRATPPDLQANETVMLLKFGEVDEYYWATIFFEPEIRRLETVLTSYSNIPSELTKYGLETSYWQLFDTANKLIRTHVSNNDGEYTIYDDILNTKEGRWLRKDGKGNYRFIDSTTDSITDKTNEHMYHIVGDTLFNISECGIVNIAKGTCGGLDKTGIINSTKSFIELNSVGATNHTYNETFTESLNDASPTDKVTGTDYYNAHKKITKRNRIRAYSDLSIFLTADKFIDALAQKDIIITSKTSVTINAPTVTINATTVNINAGTINISGNVKIGGSLSVGSGISTSGGISAGSVNAGSYNTAPGNLR